MLSKAEAIEIARAECERRDLALIDPIMVTRGPFHITVWGVSDRVGGNVVILLRSRSGAIVRVGFVPR